MQYRNIDEDDRSPQGNAAASHATNVETAANIEQTVREAKDAQQPSAAIVEGIPLNDSGDFVSGQGNV